MDCLRNMNFDCAPMVHHQTISAIIQTESSGNPFAIAVVRGPRLRRQPRDKEEAIRLIKYLENIGANYSVGLAQINKANFSKYKVNGVSLLDTCNNLKVAQKVLQECYAKSGHIQKTLSCYYSGNFTRGFKKDYGGTSYVERVYKNAGIKIPALSDTYVAKKTLPEPVAVVKIPEQKLVKTPEATVILAARSIKQAEEKTCNFLEEFCDVKL